MKPFLCFVFRLMRFRLYFSTCITRLRVGLLAGAVALVLHNCIPIVDKVNPVVDEFSLGEVYFYQDTLRVVVSFFDNTLLDSAFISVRKVAIRPDQTNPWALDTAINLRGRRFVDTLALKVPPFTDPGEYELTVIGQDRGRNRAANSSRFLLATDNRPPVLSEVALNIPPDQQGRIVVCRNQIIPVSGLATDNLLITRMGFSINGRESLLAVRGESLRLEQVFRDLIRVPNDLANGSIVNFTLVAIDSFQNRTSTSFQLLVECDDQRPTLRLAGTEPATTADGRINLVSGGLFRITNVQAADNQALRRARVFANRAGEQPELLRTIELPAVSGPVNLFAQEPLQFNFPAVQFPPGSIYEVSIEAEDQQGLRSETLRLTVNIIENRPPLITVAAVFLNEQATSLAVQPVRVGPGVRIRVEGKIEEELALARVRIYWGLSRGVPFPDLLADVREFNSLPVNLSELLITERLVIPGGVAPGTRYELVIEAEDSLGQTDVLRLLFELVL